LSNPFGDPKTHPARGDRIRSGRLQNCPPGQTRYGSNLECVAVTTTTGRTTTTTAKSPVIPAGTYVVNTDIAPGVYRVEQYWESQAGRRARRRVIRT